jgi:eukaryotic-like serine/threonine-protein kinase
MGIVYLAMARGPGGFSKLVVIKELKPELVEEPAFLTMFLDEARLAARLSHPNIVQTNEVGSDGNRYFMAMDYLDGRSLDRARRRSQNAHWQLSLALHLRIICDVLSGLEYAHRLTDFDGSPLHLVHRDISPSNVFLTFDGQVKLLDFGIAKTTDSSQETRIGVLKGKLSYMAPEQARGERVDARADVFSVGVLLWEAVAGRRLRVAAGEYDGLRSLVAEEQPRLSTVVPDVAPELDEICARALALSRDQRYPSAAAFQQDIEEFAQRAGLVASSRDLGGWLSEMFREDRVATNQLIELHAARADAERVELPIIPSGAHLGLSGFTPSREHRSPLDARIGPPPLAAPELASAAPSGAHLAPPPPRRSKILIPAVTIGVVATAAFAYVAFLKPGADLAAPQPAGRLEGSTPGLALARTVDQASQSPTAPGAESPQPAQDLVQIEINVSPSEAMISIDGADVTDNPYRGKFMRSSAVRQVRASAAGYVSKVRALAFDADLKIDMSLERKPRPAPPVARSTRPSARPPEPARAAPPPPPPQPDVNPAGGTKPRRPIDPSNPYGAE